MTVRMSGTKTGYSQHCTFFKTHIDRGQACRVNGLAKCKLLVVLEFDEADIIREGVSVVLWMRYKLFAAVFIGNPIYRSSTGGTNNDLGVCWPQVLDAMSRCQNPLLSDDYATAFETIDLEGCVIWVVDDIAIATVNDG